MSDSGAVDQRGIGPVAVLFDRLGPYHVARLRAAARRMKLVALEYCGETRDYAWNSVEIEDDFERITLFPNAASPEISTSQCRQKVFTALDDVNASAVAIPGWGSADAIAALEWCACRGRPAIVMSESTAWDASRSPWREAVKRWIVRHAAAGLAGGTPHAAYLCALGLSADRIFLGYDAVDNQHFENRSAEIRAKDLDSRAALHLPHRYFLASSRFIEKKNLLRLIDAYAAYRDSSNGEPWSLVLLGDGTQRAELLGRIAALGLDNSVMMPGFKQYDELPAYYALASGFVHASTTEQWGLVVNEAMACGLPVMVSARCGCAEDLVRDGENGWTFDPLDTAAIAASLTQLANTPEEERLSLGRRSRERIANWSPDCFAQGLQDAVEAARNLPIAKRGGLDRWALRMLARRL